MAQSAKLRRQLNNSSTRWNTQSTCHVGHISIQTHAEPQKAQKQARLWSHLCSVQPSPVPAWAPLGSSSSPSPCPLRPPRTRPDWALASPSGRSSGCTRCLGVCHRTSAGTGRERRGWRWGFSKLAALGLRPRCSCAGMYDYGCMQWLTHLHEQVITHSGLVVHTQMRTICC